MKRLLLIGFAACTFALTLTLSASAMPSANPNALIGTRAQSSKYTAVVITAAEVITTDGVEAITVAGGIITVGETLLPTDDYSRRSCLVWRLFYDNSHLVRWHDTDKVCASIDVR
jgi:hypothetical protein